MDCKYTMNMSYYWHTHNKWNCNCEDYETLRIDFLCTNNITIFQKRLATVTGHIPHGTGVIAATFDEIAALTSPAGRQSKNHRHTSITICD